jgi:hypothetical protein
LLFVMHALQADRQEALVKAEQRRMAIERANKMLFDDTDDVKALHGKLLLSEVRACRTKTTQWLRQHQAAAAGVMRSAGSAGRPTCTTSCW